MPTMSDIEVYTMTLQVFREDDKTLRPEGFKTTATYPNRQEDKQELEHDRQLHEFGNDNLDFFTYGGEFFAKGYVRIVYGDHGPYIEFTKEQIKVELVSKFKNEIDFDNLPEKPKFFYYWLHPKGNSTVKVYLQLKTVTDKPNAPKRKDGKPSCFNREEGYADYRVGYYYVDPEDLATDFDYLYEEP
jgi:hypothetical protein